MSDIVTLSKEVVIVMALNPELSGLSWLDPVRRSVAGQVKPRCRSCHGKAKKPLLDGVFYATLSSLMGSKSAEIPKTKAYAGAKTFRLPMPDGVVEI